ncbi:MAG: electron transfer flavoprotein subunit alpha/FixB family protein [Capnocytophaga sp.]|nr:electron transfer flavoprotein subunit alpha/FixB family protein [Capnocytophaga sp.]
MILVYTESENGLFKKKAFEALSYAKALAKIEGNSQVIALAINANEVSELEKYGADKIILVKNEKLNDFVAKAYLSVIEQVVQKENPKTILMSASANTRYIAPMLAAKLGAAYLSNIGALPENGSFRKPTFSSKSNAWFSVLSDKKVITLSNNCIELAQAPTKAEIITLDVSLSEDAFNIKIKETNKINTKISLADASIVVAGGRGMQTPENWNLLENLATALGAATACTKPISDMGWRPHSEHVGQTGKPIAADLYIALGISGAIQHIAGINASKVKVVINSDPEAPFFKVADYGIVGNVLDILPKLTEKIQQIKN